MSENYGYIEAFKSYRQAQTKYDYFFIGVILASLSLSLQITTTGMCSLYLLFFSWVSLAISLLFGLFRIEQINNFLRVEANSLAFTQNKSKIGIANVKSSTEIWGQEDLTNAVSRIDDNLAFSDKLMLVFNKHAIIAYQIQKWGFISAIYLFGLFRVTNIINLSFLCELLSIGVVVSGTFVSMHFYKKSMPIRDEQTANPQST